MPADNSDEALGALLGQRIDSNIIRLTAYFSKKLNNAEKRDIILEKWLLATVELKSFWYYLGKRSFIIGYDNSTSAK